MVTYAPALHQHSTDRVETSSTPKIGNLENYLAQVNRTLKNLDSHLDRDYESR